MVWTVTSSPKVRLAESVGRIAQQKHEEKKARAARRREAKEKIEREGEERRRCMRRFM